MARPRKENPSPPALRRRRLLERRKKEGRGAILLTPTAETLDVLGRLVALTGGNMKGETEMIVRRASLSALQEAEQLLARMAPISKAARVFAPYSVFLSRPGGEYRVGDRVLKADDWLRLAAEIGQFHDKVRKWGWSKSRADKFLAKAANLPT